MKKPVFRRRSLVRLAVILLVLYLASLGLMVWNETRFVYIPMTGPSDPKEAGAPNFTRHELAQAAGDPIVYWESAAKNKPTLLYFHGNGGGLYLHVIALNYLAQHFHVIAMEYPGYPSAAGKPSQQRIVADAIALYDHSVTSKTTPVIWGFSLGTGIASQLAAERQSKVLVLEAPFTAVVDRAGELFPYYPVKWLMKEQYRSREVIARIHAPLFIIHGEDDRIIPITHGRALFTFASEPKQFHAYPHFGHLDLSRSPAYADALAFIQENSN